MQFSLFFFSADGDRVDDQKYQLLLDAARFADRHQFAAVWTPERHFQCFGGLYPNPSVLGAALAMITEQLEIRAGSVAMPLHNPIRLVEEWSLVDNLSAGRVAISLASGWNEQDFALAPQNYAERRELVFRHIPTLRRLWAGDTVMMPGPDGRQMPVRTLPRPIQPGLPLWITAGSPATWLRAGEFGTNVLSALIGTSPRNLAHNIRGYRDALTRNGYDPRSRKVAVMLHTYVGLDPEELRHQVQAPLMDYLRHFVEQSFPRYDEQGGGQSAAAREELATAAFERYVNRDSLVGTPEKCAAVVDALAHNGVDEVACLVDFGLERGAVMESLRHLDSLRQRYQSPSRG